MTNQNYWHSQYRLRPDYDGNWDTTKDCNNYDHYICSADYSFYMKYIATRVPTPWLALLLVLGKSRVKENSC